MFLVFGFSSLLFIKFLSFLFCPDLILKLLIIKEWLAFLEAFFFLSPPMQHSYLQYRLGPRKVQYNLQLPITIPGRDFVIFIGKQLNLLFSDIWWHFGMKTIHEKNKTSFWWCTSNKSIMKYSKFYKSCRKDLKNFCFSLWTYLDLELQVQFKMLKYWVTKGRVTEDSVDLMQGHGIFI